MNTNDKLVKYDDIKLTQTADPVLFPNTIEQLTHISLQLAKSGLSGFGNPSQVLARILAGRELGLPPMASIRGTYIVDNQVSLNAGLMAALIRNAGHKYEVITRTAQECSIRFYRDDQTYVHTFTIDDARRADLLISSKGNVKVNWKRYPKAMLYARCMSEGAKIMYPDILAGYYTPEELGATVDQDGNVLDDPTITVTEYEPNNDPEPDARIDSDNAPPIQPDTDPQPETKSEPDSNTLKVKDLQNAIKALVPSHERRSELFQAWCKSRELDIKPSDLNIEHLTDLHQYIKDCISNSEVEANQQPEDEAID